MRLIVIVFLHLMLVQGFDNVYNRMEDFYAKIASNSLPEYDVLVTNPPYSGDHFRRICEFCRASDKPYFLLLPNFVYIKVILRRNALES